MHISSIKNTVSACSQVQMSIMSPYLHFIGDIVCNPQCIHNLSERQEHWSHFLRNLIECGDLQTSRKLNYPA